MLRFVLLVKTSYCHVENRKIMKSTISSIDIASKLGSHILLSVFSRKRYLLLFISLTNESYF